MRKVKKSLKFSGGVSNVLERRGDLPVSKYLFGASQEEEEPEGGGGSTPYSRKQTKTQTAKTKRPPEGSR